MGERDTKYVCSHCGAKFFTAEGLAAHFAILQQHYDPESAPRRGSAAATTPRPARKQQPRPAGSRSRTASMLRLLRWVAVVAICIAAAGLGRAFPHQIAHQIAISITRQPAPYTELYFSNPQALPTSLSLSRLNLFKFTIVNHEGHDTIYSYVVTLASSHGAATIARGRIDVGNGMKATRVVNVVPIRPATKYVVTTALRGRLETIHFAGVSR